MTSITVYLNPEEKALFEHYSDITHRSIETLMKDALLSKINDEYDLEIFRKSYQEYLTDPQTISHAEFKKQLGF